MAGSKSTKTIFLHVLRILMEQTDVDHPLTAEAIIDRLFDCGYSCDRKSVYRHIEAIEEFGIEVGKSAAEPRGYYIIDRQFELHELKLLADAVQMSRFITHKKSKQLIDKLGSLASEHEAKGLNRSLYMAGVNKTDNERVFYVLDAVYEAIRTNRRINFRYFRYLPNGSKEYRNDGEEYCVSPYAVVWDDEKYYMHAYHAKYDTISSFRIDLMEKASVSTLEREQQDRYEHYNPVERAKTTFSQFGGESANVICEFDNSLAGAVFDHFGTDLKTTNAGNDRFRAAIKVDLSPRFFSWLFGFGDKAKIISPQRVIDMYCEQLDSVKELYK